MNSFFKNISMDSLTESSKIFAMCHFYIFEDKKTGEMVNFAFSRKKIKFLPNQLDMILEGKTFRMKKKSSSVLAVCKELMNDLLLVDKPRFVLTAREDFLDEFHMAHVLNKGQHNKKMVKLKSKAFIKLETQTFSYLKMKRNLLNEFRLDGCYMMSYLPTSMELKMKKISKVIFAKKMIYPFAKSCSMSIADKTSYMMNLRSTRKRLFTVLKKPYTENDTIGMRLEDLANLEHCKEQVLARPDSWIYNRHELLCELISKEFDMSFKKSDVRVRKRFKVASTKTPDMLLKESGMSLTFLEVAVSESSASSRFTEKVRAYSKMVSQLEKKGYEVHMGILALNLVNSKVVMDEKTEKMLMEKNMMPKLAKFMNTLNAIEEPIKKSGVKLTELGDTLNPMVMQPWLQRPPKPCSSLGSRNALQRSGKHCWRPRSTQSSRH